MPADCCKEFWNRIPDDEPVFTIAGRDQIAEVAVVAWLLEAKRRGVNEDKIARAEKHLEWIRTFQTEYPERTKLPD